MHFLYGAALHRPALLRLETPVLLAALCKSSRILQSRILGWFAGFFMEESCRGFFASNWLCSKPGRSLCERIKLTFATAPGCLHSLSLGRHDRFGRLCNQFLPKKLRFSLQRHKTWEFGLRRIPGIICRFSLWNSARCLRIQRKLNAGLWLTVFDKKRLFRCQSAPGPPYAVPSLFEIGILITEFSESGIRGLWLGAFGK